MTAMTGNSGVQRRFSATASLALVIGIASLLSACADLEGSAGGLPDGTDYWDSALIYHRHIDVAMLQGGYGDPVPQLSGFVSAVAVNGSALYFVDQGAGQLVQVDLAMMTARSLASLGNANAPGLYADIDGRIYVVDRGQGALLVIDEYSPDTRYVRLGPLVSSPIDVAVVGAGQWVLVLDGLAGRIAMVDTLGGISQVFSPDAPAAQRFITPLALARSGNGFLVLDGGADQVIGLDLYGQPLGVFGADDLSQARALAADACGRFYVADDAAEGLYLGFADMSLPGRRVPLPELRAADVTDLWTDGIFLYVATRAEGIHVLLIDPACGES